MRSVLIGVWVLGLIGSAGSSHAATDRASTTSPQPGGSGTNAAAPAFLSHGAWTIRRQPIWGGQYGIAGDASVVRDGRGFRMAYTGFDPQRQGTEICLARSTDGITWKNDPPHGPVDGRALTAAIGTWHEAHETPELVSRDGRTNLFFIGYRSQGFFTSGGKVQMGRALVAGRPPFPLSPNTPVWTPQAAGPDAYGMTSPSIEVVSNELRLVYTGWTAALTTRLLAAISTNDGVTWQNQPGLLIEKTALPKFAAKGIAETCLRTGPDQRHYLFFTSVDDPHRLGVAVADHWLGPYRFAANPIVGPEDLDAWAATGPLAPHVIFDADRVRLWFHAIEPGKGIRLGYAEAPLP